MREWLSKIREENGMTQLEVAKQLDISEGYYCYIEAGKRQKKMDLTIAAKLSEIFKLPIEQILELERSE